MRELCKLVSTFTLIMMSASLAEAVPVRFEAETEIYSSSVPTVAAGDRVSFTMVLDNGRASVSNQFWRLSDIQTFELTAGGYWMKLYDKWWGWDPQLGPVSDPNLVLFSTDSNGTVLTARFGGSSSGSVLSEDIFGKSTFIGVHQDGFASSTGDFASMYRVFMNPTSWQISAVPEIPTVWMFIIGAAAFGGLGWPRKSAYRAA